MRDCCRDAGDISGGTNVGKIREMSRVCGSMCLCVSVWVCMCGREGGVVGWGERMIETSNQSHCREQRAGRGLLPAVTLLSVPVSRFFPCTRINR